MGEGIGALVELAVGEAGVAELDGDGVRTEGGLLLEEVVEAGVGGEVGGGGVPLHEHLVALGGGEQGDVTQAGGGGEGEERRAPVREQPLHGRGLEAGRVVDGPQAQRLRRQDREGERVIGALEALDVTHLDATRTCSSSEASRG